MTGCKAAGRRRIPSPRQRPPAFSQPNGLQVEAGFQNIPIPVAHFIPQENGKGFEKVPPRGIFHNRALLQPQLGKDASISIYLPAQIRPIALLRAA